MPITRDNSTTSVVGVESNGAGMANKSGRPGSGFSLSVLGELRKSFSYYEFHNLL